MGDKRKNNGGAREGAGRKPKADELKMVELGTNAILSVYGSIEKYWEHIARESKDSLPHLKMLQEYVYGKPKEKIDVTKIKSLKYSPEERAKRILELSKGK